MTHSANIESGSLSRENVPGGVYITGYSIFRNGAIEKDDHLVWKEASAQHTDDFLVSAYRQMGLSYPKFFKMDNLSKLGLLVSENLLSGTDLKERYKPDEISVVFANASSSLDADQKYFDTIKDIASPALFVYTLPNIVIGEICIKNGFKGENAFFVFDKFEAKFLHQYVQTLMQQNTNKACIFGWLELMGDSYEAALFLLEKDVADKTNPFTLENINKLYS
ncbi:hypothetical protein [Pinibacter soli]|uniref:3-oxoacyl-ACP synthase n=1 Tax=Pinibacter soli TaxID=3044211 RepID=A0ABT6RC01_9BACT|nr:hypothetical protein [Pinibacter soli]MDI3320096.1 hypothetical protein [Pinibacter soli]